MNAYLMHRNEHPGHGVFDRAAHDMGRAFADAADAMFDFAKKYRRLMDDTD